MNQEIAAWLDAVLEQEIPAAVAAFCLNLYDDGDDNWSIELVGAGRFDPNDPDWPCDEVTDFGTREDPLSWEETANWEKILETATAACADYLAHGSKADVLKSKAAVGIGFVDGEIQLLFEA